MTQVKQPIKTDSTLGRYPSPIMDDLKRSSFYASKNLHSRQWGSETDLEKSSLPPIPGGDKKNGKWLSSGKHLFGNRPPTPSLLRKDDSLHSWGKTSRGSPASSTQRLSLSLSLSLDSKPNIKAGDFRRYSSSFADVSPESWSSPRPVRSLPPSPTAQRSHRLHRYLTRLSSDSEQTMDKVKDDRIIKWIRDVSAGVHSQNDEGEEEDVFDSSSENVNDSEGSSISPGLPVIKEGWKT